MDFRVRKLSVAIWILVIGMVVALVYHGWQGWGLGKSYPENTFLFYPEDRYGDFTNPYRFAETGVPYRYVNGGANYFPAAFLIFDGLAWLPPVPATVLFLTVCSAGLYVLLEAALRPVVAHPGWRMLATIALLWTYPYLLVLDRGNTEILLVLMVGASLYYYSRKRFRLSFLLLLPPICFKLYPALLLLLFFRQRLFHWVFIAAASFVFVSWLVLLTFPGTVLENIGYFGHQIDHYNNIGLLGYRNVATTASAWNSVKAGVWLAYSHSHHGPEFVGQLPFDVIHPVLKIYNGTVLACLVLLTLYVLLVEKSLPRKLLLLLIFMTVSAAGAGDYKMMYLVMAIVVLVLTRERRPWDLVVTCLLAFCVVPKREYLLHFMGVSDSGKFDASVGVILNPLCMLIALGILLWSGWRASGPLRLQQQFRKFLAFFRFPGLRPIWATIRPVPQVKKRHRSKSGRRS